LTVGLPANYDQGEHGKYILLLSAIMMIALVEIIAVYDHHDIDVSIGTSLSALTVVKH
jgi:hypothetical protein